MTASTSTSSAPAAPANGNQAARHSSGSSAASKTSQNNPADLFSSLMGLLSATDDNPLSLAGEGLAGGTDSEDTDALLLSDPSALGNPLADLIGWPGAIASMASDSTSAGLAAGATPPADLPDNQAGLSLQGMTLLAEPVAADPKLVADLKLPAAANASANASASNSLAAAANAANTPANPDAVAVTYGEAETANPSRSAAYMAARPANWRSTTALSTAGPATVRNTAAPSTTAAIQVAQNTGTQRNLVADPVLTAASRNSLAQGERLSDAGVADATAAELGAVAGLGQAAEGRHSGASGGGREDGLLMGAAQPEPGDLDAPEEAFSLDAALAAEEELEGTEFMNPQQLRNASVRIGEGTDEALDIRLSLEGDAVNVDFRTDNAEVRAGLQHNAGTSLNDLMQRGGVQLGGVSIGGQSQQPGGQSGNPESDTPRVGGASLRKPLAEGQGGEAGGRPPAARRGDGGPALDVFA